MRAFNGAITLSMKSFFTVVDLPHDGVPTISQRAESARSSKGPPLPFAHASMPVARDSKLRISSTVRAPTSCCSS